ncbi:hypothetical protein IEQ34_016322 [Dendrobium chrysotoxum]|uniref:Uncharacterized protein n=1 Tax=Dendrobium chrysotoxum TaxID=161865 RepID=A0AAV7GG73_DENCH|nr:hypothetical protein IEQ34_016322 [Dendrobium chrysotoxum]
MSSLMLPKWSTLLLELLLMVVERLHIADKVRVSATRESYLFCMRWSNGAASDPLSKVACWLHDLMFEPHILNPLTRKEFRLPSLLTIPTDNKAIFDGSDGAVLEFINYRNRFSYPTNIFRDTFIRRVIITDAPPNGVVVAFYDFNYEDACMALARSGLPYWVPLPKV